MQVNLYETFEKLFNSTKRPAADAAKLEIEGNLRESTSIFSPRFAFDFGVNTAPTQYTYAYVYAFGFYYFVNDWEWVAPYWECTLAIDVLASYRTAIINSSQYVLRAAAQFDTDISDSFYPTISKTSVVAKKWDTGADNIWGSTSFSEGRYIVGIINGDNEAVGGVAYYYFFPAKFRELMHTLLTTDSWLGGDVIERSNFNPTQYISTVLWSPIGMTDDPTTKLSKIKFGWWEVDAECYRCSTNPFHIISPKITIPKHPQAARGSYLNTSPYSIYRLEFWPYGVLDLDGSYLMDSNTIYTVQTIDNITGTSVLAVYNDKDQLIQSSTGVVGVQVQIAQLTTDFSGVGLNASTAIAAAGSVVSHAGEYYQSFKENYKDTGNFFSDAWNAIRGAAEETKPITNIGNALMGANTKVTTQGTTGSIAAFTIPQHLVCQFWYIANEDIVSVGRPLCKTVKLGDLAGFIQCRNSHLEISAIGNIRAAITNFLDGGVYIE